RHRRGRADHQILVRILECFVLAARRISRSRWPAIPLRAQGADPVRHGAVRPAMFRARDPPPGGARRPAGLSMPVNELLAIGMILSFMLFLIAGVPVGIGIALAGFIF